MPNPIYNRGTGRIIQPVSTVQLEGRTFWFATLENARKHGGLIPRGVLEGVCLKTFNEGGQALNKCYERHFSEAKMSRAD
jgi:hypothetical protein